MYKIVKETIQLNSFSRELLLHFPNANEKIKHI